MNTVSKSQSFSFQAEGIILHRYPYQNGLLVKFLTEQAGLFPAVVKSGSNKYQKSLVQPFSWVSGELTGRGEVKNLKHIEVLGHLSPTTPRALCAALYLSELTLMFVKPGEIYENLVQALAQTLKSLSESNLEPHLRTFELYLMATVGYALPLSQDHRHQPIQHDAFYRCLPGQYPQKNIGFEPGQTEVGLILKGETLLSIHEQTWDNPLHLKQAKFLLRQWIDYYAQGKVLKSRELFYTPG